MKSLKQYVNIINESLLDDEDTLLSNNTGEKEYLKKEFIKIIRDYKSGTWNNREVNFDKLDIEYDGIEKMLSMVVKNSCYTPITIPYKDFVEFSQKMGLDIKTITSNTTLNFDGTSNNIDLKDLIIKCPKVGFKNFDVISNVIYILTDRYTIDVRYHDYNANVHIINKTGKTNIIDFKCDTKIPVSNPGIPPHRLPHVRHNALIVDDIEDVKISTPISNITALSVLSAMGMPKATGVFNKYFMPGVAVFHDREKDVDVPAKAFGKYLTMLKNRKKYTVPQERVNIFSEDLGEILNLPDLKLIEFPYMWSDCMLAIDLVNGMWVPRIIK